MFFIQANPQYKTITVYDAHMKMLGKEGRAELLQNGSSKNEQVNGKEIKNDKPPQNKETVKEEVSGGTKKAETVKKNTEKSKGEKHSQTSASGKSKKEKKDAVKNLLPQKDGEGTKKGLRA